ncbi:MAG: phosphatase PAP2 family protein [Bacteroidaceae bacterium]|nr:phosphatase PAP2 family protein [Bacteroidaceae bacterium]
MALIHTLTQPIEKQQGLFAIERISLMYNAFTTVLIGIFYMQLANPGIQLIERMGIVGMTLLFYMWYQWRPCRLTTFVRVVSQMFLLMYWYPDTYEFNRLFPNLDHLFAEWEQRLFDCQPALCFSEMCHTTWWSEAFNMGYWAYYPMTFLVVFYYFFARYEKFKQITFVILCSFFMYYLIYIFLPVTGPQFYFNAIGLEQAAIGFFPNVGDYFLYHSELLPNPDAIDGFFFRLVENAQAAGERPTAAFPSSHVGISTILMILAGKANRRLMFFMLPFYILLCGATVYIQAHYMIDAIAGFFSALLIYWMSSLIYTHRRKLGLGE